MTLTVGAHPQNPSLSILARRQEAVAALAEQGLSFFVYAAGSQTIPLLKTGVLHLAGTGATPPILAKAEGFATAVFGIGEPRPERGGLLVRADSDIHSLHDLQGKGIGLMPISWHLQFLAAELDAAGLPWNHVRAAEIIPATAKDAFLAGLLDAIVATDPLYTQIARHTPVRIIAAPGAAFSNRTVFWGPTEVLRDHPEAVRALLRALIASDQATAADPAAGRLRCSMASTEIPRRRGCRYCATVPGGISAPGPDSWPSNKRMPPYLPGSVLSRIRST